MNLAKLEKKYQVECITFNPTSEERKYMLKTYSPLKLSIFVSRQQHKILNVTILVMAASKNQAIFIVKKSYKYTKA